MKIYPNEISAGLQDRIMASASILYDSPVLLDEKIVPEFIDLSAHASLNAEDCWDLYPIKSILVSAGCWNKNDDVFDIEEAFAARNSPIHKKFNFEHDEKDIIGHIISSVVVDQEGKIIDNVKNVSKFDIVVGSVIYRCWRDKELQERMNGILEGIAQGKWFVSMECMFSDFDYAVIDASGKHYTIARNEETSFLTKHLRIYEGSGTYDGKKIGRLLRNMTFSGKGLVAKPANERSIIFTDTDSFEPAEATILTSISKEKNVMSDELKALQEQLAKANARNEVLEAEAKKTAEKAVAEKISGLEGTIAGLNETVTKKDAEIAAKATEVADANKKVEKVEADLAEANKKLAEANEKLEKAEKEKAEAARIGQLTEAGLDKAKAEELVAKWAGATDEQFADIVELAAAAKDDKMKEKKDDKKKEDSEEADANEATAETSLEEAETDADDASLATAGEAPGATEFAAASEWVRQVIESKTNKSGEKK